MSEALTTTNIILTSDSSPQSQLLLTCSNNDTIQQIIQQVSEQTAPTHSHSTHFMSLQLYIHTNSSLVPPISDLTNSSQFPSLSLSSSPPSPFSSSSFEKLLQFFQSVWASNFFLNMNSMILYLRPAMTTLLHQKAMLDHIVKILYKSLGTIAFPTGVAITHATLPDEKIEMTVLFHNPIDPKWHLKFHDALLPDNPLDNPPPLHSIQFQGKDRSTTLSVGDVNVRMTVNDIAALYNSALYEEVDCVICGDGLMKTSYLFIKCWLVNDSDMPTGLSLFSIPLSII
jgi:hypothetical protein